MNQIPELNKSNNCNFCWNVPATKTYTLESHFWELYVCDACYDWVCKEERFHFHFWSDININTVYLFLEKKKFNFHHSRELYDKTIREQWAPIPIRLPYQLHLILFRNKFGIFRVELEYRSGRRDITLGEFMLIDFDKENEIADFLNKI